MTDKHSDSNCQFTDQQWYDAWVANGYNATEAYLSLKPDIERTSAATGGMRRHELFKEGNVYKCIEDKLLSNVDELLGSKDERIKLQITKDQLDRFKGKAQDKLDLTSKGEKIHIDASKLTGDELNAAIKEIIEKSK